MPSTSSQKFADKYLLAVEQAIKEKPSGGLNGFGAEIRGDKSPAQFMEVLRTCGESVSTDFQVLRRGFIPDESRLRCDTDPCK